MTLSECQFSNNNNERLTELSWRLNNCVYKVLISPPYIEKDSTEVHLYSLVSNLNVPPQWGHQNLFTNIYLLIVQWPPFYPLHWKDGKFIGKEDKAKWVTWDPMQTWRASHKENVGSVFEGLMGIYWGHSLNLWAIVFPQLVGTSPSKQLKLLKYLVLTFSCIFKLIKIWFCLILWKHVASYDKLDSRVPGSTFNRHRALSSPHNSPMAAVPSLMFSCRTSWGSFSRSLTSSPSMQGPHLTQRRNPETHSLLIPWQITTQQHRNMVPEKLTHNDTHETASTFAEKDISNESTDPGQSQINPYHLEAMW